MAKRKTYLEAYRSNVITVSSGYKGYLVFVDESDYYASTTEEELLAKAKVRSFTQVVLIPYPYNERKRRIYEFSEAVFDVIIVNNSESDKIKRYDNVIILASDVIAEEEKDEASEGRRKHNSGIRGTRDTESAGAAEKGTV